MANRSMELKVNRAKMQRREAGHMEGTKSGNRNAIAKADARREIIIKTWEYWAAGHANAAGNGAKVTRCKTDNPKLKGRWHGEDYSKRVQQGWQQFWVAGEPTLYVKA